MPSLVAPEINYTGLQTVMHLADMRNRNTAMMQKLAYQMAEKDKQLEIQQANYQSLDTYRRGEVLAAQTRADITAAKADRLKENAQDVVDFQNALNDIEAEPGTKEWRVKANIVRSQFPRLMATPDGKRLWDESANNHRAAAGEARQATNDVINDYFKNVQAVTGNRAFDPDQWGVAQEKGTMYRAFDTNGNPLSKDTPKEKVARYQHIKTSDYETLKEQRNHLEETLSKGLMSSPDLTPPPHKIKVISPDGKQGFIPDSQLQDALNEGYKQIE